MPRTYPSLFRSMTLGNMECTYVEVHMINRMTSRRDWKLKMAVYNASRLLVVTGQSLTIVQKSGVF